MPAKQFQFFQVQGNDTRAPEVSAGIRDVPTLLPPSWDGQQGLVALKDPPGDKPPLRINPSPSSGQEMLDRRPDPGRCWRPRSQEEPIAPHASQGRLLGKEAAAFPGDPCGEHRAQRANFSTARRRIRSRGFGVNSS